MMNSNCLLLCSVMLAFLSACDRAETAKETTVPSPEVAAIEGLGEAGQAKIKQADQDETVENITWENLVTADFSLESLLKRFESRIEKVQDGTEEADQLMEEVTAVLNSAPVNEAVAGKKVSIDGFIAPITVSGETVTEFLLAPYVGACIHVPAPPINQTIFVSLQEGQNLSVYDTYSMMTVTGVIEVANKKKTELGTAGYIINDATIRLSLNQ